MDYTKLFNGIKDVIIDWLVPYTKRVAHLGGYWHYDSYARAFYWRCSSSPSYAYSYMGAYLCDNGEIRIWTGNKENINLRIYYDIAISNVPIVSHNADSEHKDFSVSDINSLYIKIKKYIEKNKELVMPSNEEKGYGKIVDDLTIDDLKKYEEAGISILLVRNQLTPEVLRDISEYKPKMAIYTNLNPKVMEELTRHIASIRKGDSDEVRLEGPMNE